MKTYNEKKEETRQKAIEWQNTFFERNDSYNQIFTWQQYFEKNGKKYGLLKEFKENGIL